jgi:hypothetical protein
MYKIAISGKANSGKNVTGKRLIECLKLTNYKICAFADPIKQIAKIMFPQIPDSDLWGPSDNRTKVIENESITIRQLLINIGENFKYINNNVWINHFDRVSKECILANQDVILTDLRFITEYDYLKANGFILIRVKRDKIKTASDKTETEQDKIPDDKFDFVIKNNSTLYDFHKEIDSLALKIS